MAWRNRVPESVSAETPKAKALQRRRKTEEIQRRVVEHPDISAVSAKTRKWQKEHKDRMSRMLPSKQADVWAQIPGANSVIPEVRERARAGLSPEEQRAMESARLAEQGKEAGVSYAVPGMIIKAPAAKITTAEKMLQGVPWEQANWRATHAIKQATGVEKYLGDWVEEVPDPIWKSVGRTRTHDVYPAAPRLEWTPANNESGALWPRKMLSAPQKFRYNAEFDDFVVPGGRLHDWIFDQQVPSYLKDVNPVVWFRKGGPRGTSATYFPPTYLNNLGEIHVYRAHKAPKFDIDSVFTHEVQHAIDESPSGVGTFSRLLDTPERRTLQDHLLQAHGSYFGLPGERRAFNAELRHSLTPERRSQLLLEDTDLLIDHKFNKTSLQQDAKGGKAPKLSEEQRVARVNAGIAKHPGFSKGDIEDMRRSAAFIADPQNAIRGLLVEGTLKHDAERPVFYSKNSWEDGQEGFQGDRFSMAHTLDDGRVVVIPSIYADEDGATRLHTGRDALKHYEQTGEHFGIYDSMENAERASVWSHHAGNAGWLKRLEKQQDAMGGDAGAASGGQVSEPGGGTFVLSPSAGGGPRIVINPSTFRNEKDALCVAFNEAFRLVMEEMGFNPVAEPTEAQRRFFSDTAYRNDELQLRRTILARVCTFDTSVKDPTDEQLQEAVEFLTSVLEAGAPQNEWEQRSVMRLRDVIAQVSQRGVPDRGPRDAAARPGSPGGRAPGRGTGGST